MKKINSLILLINSLSKAEKKSIYLHSNLTKGKKVYMELFTLIDKDKITDSTELQARFTELFSTASFHPVASYLYDFVLNILVRIKSNQDKEFALHQKILTAKILEERNLNGEYYDALQQLKVEALEINNYHLLLIIRRMELDFLRTNEFFNISEKQLMQKQHRTNDALKILRQTNEQSALYELLLLRIQKTHPAQRDSQKQFLNDLVVSEISLVSNLNRDVFEIQKLHQLFQAQYLIFVDDYKSALNCFIELDNLFNANKSQWNNPPMYYVKVLEGILISLKGIKAYQQMQYFLDKLKALEHPSISFQAEVACIRFIYTISPLLECRKHTACKQEIDNFSKDLISKIDLLNPYRYLQLSLYLSIIYFRNNNLERARRQMTLIINGDSYTGLSLFRPMQLVNLIIHYELGDFDIITSRVRSIKRHNRIQKTNSQLEDLLFYFLGLDLVTLSENKRKSLRLRIINELQISECSADDKRLLAIFDFEKWMLKHLGYYQYQKNQIENQ